MAIFLRQLRRYRGQIVGWGIGLFLLGTLIIPLYGSIAGQADQLQALIDSYPPEMLAFFGGGDIAAITTPDGWLSLEYFAIMPIVLGIYAILTGSGLLASDEENGTLDLIMAHPMSRTRFFLARVAALEVALLLILAIAYLGLLIPGILVDYPLTAAEFAAPFVSLFPLLLLFASVALLASMLVPSRRMAAMIGGLVMVGSYFVSSLAQINSALERAARLSPMSYFQGGDAIAQLNWGWVVGLLAVAGLLVTAAWWLFERRDIRVGGEGGFMLSLRRQRAT